MAKLYKAVDKMDGSITAFLLRDDGEVCKSLWTMDDGSEVRAAKRTESMQTPCRHHAVMEWMTP